MDQFYALVTGKEDAFYQMCMVLPETIEKVVNSGESISIPEDTVLDELRNIASQIGEESESFAMAVYMLEFNTYNGFKDKLKGEGVQDEAMLKRLYKYAKMMTKM